MWFLMLVSSALSAPSAQVVAARHPEIPVVVAHRGASFDAPENTLAAYREAIAQGATIAETDVHITVDGEVVVLHDKTLERTTTGSGSVAKQLASAVTSLDAGSWFHPKFSGEKVPTLTELLELVRGKMVLCIEIKSAPFGGGERIAEAIRDRLDQTGTRDQAIIFSFHPQQISASKSAMPDVPALFLVRPKKGGLPYSTGAITMARSIGADMLGIDHRRTTATFVSQAQNAGFPVFVYTVDGAAKIDAMVGASVDGIISNGPAKTRAHLDAIKRSTP